MYPATNKGPGAASTASEAKNTFSLQKNLKNVPPSA